ncbi:hypothetical protein V6N11_058065 [Hibiscus sabdariffa]|uniref:histone deacetylase n=1 Tax=Hibiscus sabdariffa TaxID=183260 RepID=A0ABR2N822_9ROSI
MTSEAVQVNCVMNGEANNNQALKRKHLVSNENITACYCDVASVDTGDIGASGRDMFANGIDDRQPDGVSKKARLQKEVMIQDMYNNQDASDDEDGSDWEPVQKCVEIMKWFCTNCTMVNLNDTVHCDICGEHKASGILRHGFYASPCSPEVDLIQVESEARQRDKDLQLEASSSNCLTAVGFDEKMLLHSEVEKKSHPHPERPDRLQAIAASLAASGIFPGKCCPIPAREITKEELQKVHSLEHIEAIEFTSQVLSSYFSPDTYANEHSARSARLAAGLCADLASAIFSGHMRNGFDLLAIMLVSRKQWDSAYTTMQQLLHWQLRLLGQRRCSSLIGMFIMEMVPKRYLIRINRYCTYPCIDMKEGSSILIGSKVAEGYCVNIPWSCGGVGDNDYIFAFQHVVLPIASKFAPDFTIISAGFDAACGDPLGGCDVTPAGYAQMTHMLSALCGGKMLVILEGGYNLRSISSSATAVVKVMLGESSECEPENIAPSKAGLLTVLEVLKIQMKYWPSLSSSFEKLQAQWGMHCTDNQSKGKEVKKRRVFEPPMWWSSNQQFGVRIKKIKMEDSGAILYQISCLKEMLDQVNEEVESNIQVTREIESEIVKCTEFEAALTTRESQLTKSLYVSHFEIDGLLSVSADSRNSLKFLEDELSCLTTKRDEMLKRIEQKREGFTKLCLEFQREIDIGESNEMVSLLSEKERLENEIHLLDKKNNAFRNSMSAFVEEVLEDLFTSNAATSYILVSVYTTAPLPPYRQYISPPFQLEQGT